MTMTLRDFSENKNNFRDNPAESGTVGNYDIRVFLIIKKQYLEVVNKHVL